MNLMRWYKDSAKREEKASKEKKKTSLLEWYWDNVSCGDSVEKVESPEEETVNVVNTDRESVDEAKMENLPKSLDEEEIESNEVEVFESCQKSVKEENVNESCSIGHYDKEKMLESQKRHDEGGEAIVEPKLEKENRLVFDPEKIIKNNNAIFNEHYNPIDGNNMPVQYGSERAMTGFGRADYNVDLFQQYSNFDEDADTENKDDQMDFKNYKVERMNVISNEKDNLNIKISLVKGDHVFLANNKETENLPESDEMATLRSTSINIVQDFGIDDLIKPTISRYSNKLVVDQGKLIKDSDEIDFETMLKKPDSGNAVTGLDEHATKKEGKDVNLNMQGREIIEDNDTRSNLSGNKIDTKIIFVKFDGEDRVDKFDEAAGKDDIKNNGLKIQNNANVEIGIKMDKCKSSTIELDPKVARHDGPIMKKKYNEEFEGSVATDCDGDKAPDGRAENVSIGMRSIRKTRDENVEYKYYHEYGFHDERLCQDKGLACDLELVQETESNEKGRMHMKNMADKKVDVSKAFKDNVMQGKMNKKKRHTKEFRGKHLLEIRIRRAFDRERILLDNLLKIMELWRLFLQIIMERRPCFCWKL
ncbi:hypothetical protein C2G38_2158680 [Gigaspora rosea]|uniref:Uncharacterized protein n=1 Tax=Gigaspora rosea TaxID=44941 RepID=A0A397W238_9GLOM|nr:hypothetical protein C2G38_2158680 [Gigaspora rosea]